MEDIKIYLKELKELCVQVDEVAYKTRMKIYELEEQIWKLEGRKFFSNLRKIEGKEFYEVS
jgi:hypothetical protein